MDLPSARPNASLIDSEDQDDPIESKTESMKGKKTKHMSKDGAAKTKHAQPKGKSKDKGMASEEEDAGAFASSPPSDMSCHLPSTAPTPATLFEGFDEDRDDEQVPKQKSKETKAVKQSKDGEAKHLEKHAKGKAKGKSKTGQAAENEDTESCQSDMPSVGPT